MNKKFLPFIILLAAALLLYYVKQHQRGSKNVNIDTTTVTIPATTTSEFNRSALHIKYSRHARCRMECRNIDESEVKEILANGQINVKKIQEDGRGKTYPLEGVTHDKQHVRIVFAPKGDEEVEVVTCIDLDTDWPCDCK